VGADRAALRHVVIVKTIGFDAEAALQIVDRFAAERAFGKRPLHALDGPEQVDRGRPRGAQQLAVFLKLGGELLGAGRLAARRTERQAHRRADADRRRAADHHGLDRLGDVVDAFAGDVNLVGRQLALIDHHNVFALPRYRWKHVDVRLQMSVCRSIVDLRSRD
jgi:hypothetical protein